jgi:beta-glucosidase
VDQTNKPLYPFGHGLSYTTFALDNLKLNQAQAAVGEAFTLSVTVTNTGRVAGSEVVQLYARDVSASVTRPIKELKGFKRVYLNPGETQTIRFEVFANQFGFYDQSMQYVLEPGIIKLMIGTSAEDLPLETEINIVGPVAEISADKVFFSTATTDLK